MTVNKQIAIINSVLLLLQMCFTLDAVAGNRLFDRIVSFGGSLSDSGNAFVLLSNPDKFGFTAGCDLGTPANVPPYEQLDDFYIPDGTYARGGHHVTNGATWVEQLAQGKGWSGYVRPALRHDNDKAGNYAAGGARAGDFPCRFNLLDQLDAYLSDFTETSPGTLVTFELGGNDVRDALVVLAQGQDPLPVIDTALSNIAFTIQTLYAQGARNVLLLNVPALGNTPAVRKLNAQLPGAIAAANALTMAFNEGLLQLQNDLNAGLPGIDIRTLYLFGLLDEILSDPAAFGLVNTTDTCVTPELPPFVCKKADTYMFWDGIHPTKAVHGIMAQRAAEVVVTMPW